MKKLLLILFSGLFLVACSPKTEGTDAPDYELSFNWFQVERSGEADLFYVCSTCVFDRTGEDGSVRHYASVTDSLDRSALLREMTGVDQRLSGPLNFYSPYYRQITMESYEDSRVAEERFMAVSNKDLQDAFRHYIRYWNKGRPFVLAGFSQGGQAVVQLLREMPDSVYRRMVAAYVIGWHISAQDVKDYPAIRPARGASDTGVTICYNTVKTPQDALPIITEGNVVAINPVNWCTDSTPGVIMDTVTVHLDPATHLLLASGYERTDHAFPPYFNGGNYHTFEIRWYTPQLRQNIQDRLQAFLQP